MKAERPLLYPNQPSNRVRSVRSKGRSQLARLKWLLVAVGLCWLSWPVPAEAQCEHDLCEQGVGLSEDCDPCVTDICFLDPFCCDPQVGVWDDFCVEQVLTVCEDWTCAAACSHGLCETGEPLDSTCNFCAALVCFQDPSCCADSWDAFCINKVRTQCDFQCEAGADKCADALPISSGRIFGTLIGSTNDGCESGQNSCGSGDVWYKYTQAVDQDMLLSTCSTQRSFGIDTVLSVHTGCPGVPGNEIIENDDWMLGFEPQACINSAAPNLLDSALPLGGFFALDPGETVKIRMSHHSSSARGNFELKILPEPEVWRVFVAGAGALGALSRRRARR